VQAVHAGLRLGASRDRVGAILHGVRPFADGSDGVPNRTAGARALPRRCRGLGGSPERHLLPQGECVIWPCRYRSLCLSQRSARGGPARSRALTVTRLPDNFVTRRTARTLWADGSEKFQPPDLTDKGNSGRTRSFVILLGPITGRELSAKHFQFRTAYYCRLPGSIRKRQRRAARVRSRASWPCGDRPHSSATSVRPAPAVAASPSLMRLSTPSTLPSNQFSGEGRGKLALPRRCVLWANLGGVSAYHASGDRCISARKKPEQSGYDAGRVNAPPW
jgi:hypothetical protein